MKTYELLDRRTFLPMAIAAACSLVLFVFLLLLYKKLALRPSQNQEKPAALNALSFADLSDPIAQSGQLIQVLITIMIYLSIYLVQYIQ